MTSWIFEYINFDPAEKSSDKNREIKSCTDS